MESKKPLATIEMESGALIRIELEPENTPNTVNNFIALANEGFYNGLTFHRIIPGFMIQGGCPKGVGTGGPGYSIRGEFSANNVKNALKHKRGLISMARSQHNDSAGCQFFITVDSAPHLDGQYAAFGRVIEGMEEVDRIATLPSDPRDKPVEPVIIKSITIDTRGVVYEAPQKI